jgi:hypothetical protein
MNPEDSRRDAILRYLFERHKTTRGIKTIPCGIRDLQKAMKTLHAMSQTEVASNLDYLVQAGWVREVVRERTFKTAKGMELSQEQVKYKISDVGIDHMEAASVFKKPESGTHINITNLRGVTVVGDGNVVNSSFTDLARALDDLDKALAGSGIEDDRKLEAAADLGTIRSQIGKADPSKSVVATAWASLSKLADVVTLTDAVMRVGALVAPLLGG